MTGFLHFLLGLAGAGLGWATLGAPLVALAIRSARSRAHSALVINGCGVMLALPIAVAGPGFFDSLMTTAAKGMLR